MAPERDSAELLPLYAGCLNGQHTRGHIDFNDMIVDSGELLAVTVAAHHPYVEWTQCCYHTPFWSHTPVMFHAVKKVYIQFGVRAFWSHDPISGINISIDMIRFPKPPPPPPAPWEWCEGTLSYAQRILVRPSSMRSIPSSLLRFQNMTVMCTGTG